jgi:hypothetical protein
MATPSANYTGLTYADLGDDNNTASGQVSGAVTSIATAFEDHDHSPGNGAEVPSTAVGMVADLDMRHDRSQPGEIGPSRAILECASLQLIEVTAGTVANRSIFLDKADSRLKWKDGTGTVRTFTTVPAQP